MRDITIKPALNGYVVRLGCQRVVFNNRETMLRALNDYLDAPDEIEEQYMRNSMNSKQLGFLRDNERACACETLVEHPDYATDPHDD